MPALLQPLPVRDADRVLRLWETRLDRGFNQASFTEANFWDVRAQNRVFEDVGAYHSGEANLTGDGPARKVTAHRGECGVLPHARRHADRRPRLPLRKARGSPQRRHFGKRFLEESLRRRPNDAGPARLRLNDRPTPWWASSVRAIPGSTIRPTSHAWPRRRGSRQFRVRRDRAAAPGVTPEAAPGDSAARRRRSARRAYPKDARHRISDWPRPATWIASDTTRRACGCCWVRLQFPLLIAV